MSEFDKIVGYDKIKTHLLDAIQYNKVYHAYIFNSEKGMGKKMLARAFSMALQCEKGGRDACMECHSCKQALSGNHPDIIWLAHEKPQTIGVEDVRRGINEDIYIKPYSSRYKIYIIDDAQKLTVQAQNAILKTIEEPPQYAVILFLTTNSELFLPTILSRCTMIDLKPISGDLIREYLMKECEIPDYKAEFCEEFAQGNLGKAIRLAVSEEFAAMKEDVLTILRYGADMQIPDMAEAIKQASKYKLTINDYIDFMVMWYRDILMYKATKDANRIMFKDELGFIRRQAELISYNGAQNILDACDKAKTRLNANVNFDLVLELMLLTIKENSR